MGELIPGNARERGWYLSRALRDREKGMLGRCNRREKERGVAAPDPIGWPLYPQTKSEDACWSLVQL